MKNSICSYKVSTLALTVMISLGACTTSSNLLPEPDHPQPESAEPGNLGSVNTAASHIQSQPQAEEESAEDAERPLSPAHYAAIDYYSWVVTAESGQMQHEQSRLEQEISGGGEKHSLVQLALLISARSSDPHQEQRALELLDEYQQQQGISMSNDYYALAHLWRQALEPRLQSHELRQKIDALTLIEQQLRNREQQGG